MAVVFGGWLSVGQSVGLVFLCVVPLLSGELDVHSFVYSNTPPDPSQEGSVLLPYEGGQGDVSLALVRLPCREG